MELKGKKALVTAAGQGIGKATALALAEAGAQVWATDINKAVSNDFGGQTRITNAPLDVRDKAAIDALCLDIGTVDILFNCAGVVHAGDILATTDHDIEAAFSLNVRAQIWMIQAVLPGMLAKRAGSIINMASSCSSIKGLPNRCIYGTTKAAVIGLTKSVAADYVGKGVRCNAICPGTVDTPSLADRINANADPAQARRDFIAGQPMGRLATAEEIAPLVVYLASEQAKFVTGQAWAIDGGMTI